MTFATTRAAFPAALIAAFLLTAAPALAAETPRLLTVSGQGEVKAEPDEAMLSAGVTSEAKTAAAALADNTRGMNAVFATLKDAGIADRDIQTSNFSVQPQYSPVDSSANAPQRITGYRVSNDVSVTVETLSKLGATLDALVSSGANSIGEVAFAIKNPKPLQSEARAAAVADAIAKAQVLAKAAGVTLGPITSIGESGYEMPRPMNALMAMRGRASAPVPIAAGQESLTASVTISWEIR